jgi:hypothetical protein
MLTAILTRPTTIHAAGIMLTHRTPVLQLCRALVEAGQGDGPMTVVDAATGREVMQVASIAAAAGVSVHEEPTTRFAKWQPFNRSSLDE